MQLPGLIDPVVTARPPAPADRIPLIGLSRPELVDALDTAGIASAKMRASQLWQWVYNRGVTDPALMTNIAKDARARIADVFEIGRPEVSLAQTSTDGTRKWLLRMADGAEAEMVFIPEADRGTLCVSSAGRLHAQLHLLPHRHDAAGAQPDRWRDRRAGDARARRSGRMALAPRRAPADQHRAHGHGRAAV